MDLEEFPNICEAAPDLLASCLEFIRKCECGEARSTRSYTQMKEAVEKARGQQEELAELDEGETTA